MKLKKTSFFSILLMICLISCNEKDLTDKTYNKGVNIIPQPQELKLENSHFYLNSKTQFSYSTKEVKPIIEFFQQKIKSSTGIDIPISKHSSINSIALEIDSTSNIKKEGYELKINPNHIKLKAATLSGLFYGMNTLIQMLPAEIESKSVVKNTKWSVPTGEIKDYPRFKYRGLMIDVARHFTSIENLKKQIDVLSLFKINRLHLHLSDYQGWRIEIKKYPLLTQIGSIRIDEYGKEYKGFYTQEEIKDLVKYAKERFVTIIPEIDIPGHSLAAIASYPNLSCTEKQYSVMSRWGGFPVVFCPGKENMFELMDEVIKEMATLFPSKYFHIGGDECPKEVWKTCPNCQKRIREEKLYANKKHSAVERLQSYAISRCEKILHKYGKKMIGWDEILEGGLAPDATVMSWRGERGGIASAKQNHNVIMTPTSGGLYLDHYQGDYLAEPFAWGGFAPLEKTYSYNPVPKEIRNTEQEKYIIGVQANAWTECMYDINLLEYRIYPRIIAVAEIGWSDNKKKNFEDFTRRLNNTYVRLDKHQINYHIPLPQQPNGSVSHIAFRDSAVVTLTSTRPIKIVYTITPSTSSKVYDKPLTFKKNTTLKVASLLPSGKRSLVRTITIEKQKPIKALEVNPQRKGVQLKIADEKIMYAKEIDNIKQWKDSISENLNVISRLRPSFYNDVVYYVAVARSYVNIKTSGTYFFSSNNTRVWIDNQLVVDNDGKPQVNSKFGKSIILEKGWHALRVEQISNFFGGWNSQHRNDGSIYYKKKGENKFRKIESDDIKY